MSTAFPGLVSLMQEVQECVEVMVQLFNPSDPAGTSPSHLITVLKAALRQMAIGEGRNHGCGAWVVVCSLVFPV